MKFIPLNITAIRLTGSDRTDFLQGQVSNDIKKLSIPGSIRALILNARGQIEFDLYVHRRENDFYLQTEAGLGQSLYDRLKRYIVFDDVQLEDISSRLAMFHVLDNEVLNELGYSGNSQLIDSKFGTLLVSEANRIGRVGFDLHVLAEYRDNLLKWLNERGELLSNSTFARYRVLSKRTNVHLDNFMGLLPQGCGLDEAISYTKGCYIGQEIMARIESRGHMDYELVLLFSAKAFTMGSVLSSKKKAGRVGQVVEKNGFYALATLRKDAEKELLVGNTHVQKL